MRYFTKLFAWLLSWYWRWRIRRAGAVIPVLNKMMTKAGYCRSERRQFWRDFVSNAKTRAMASEKMLNQR